ncbi:MAG TPA: phosphoglucosamine mutase [Blastocatellia bacterium]|nr:phosphoglucosamine mutase [Blastocatellia bacterium]
MTERLFGTDGMRGVAGEFPLNEPTVYQLGKSLSRILRRENGHSPRIIIGRDTRESGPWLERAVAAGVIAEGGTAESAGVTTTPGVAFLAKRFGFDSGIVISASHNPFADNGIKVFAPSGRKLEDRFEREIEAELAGEPSDLPPANFEINPSAEYNGSYLQYLKGEIAKGLNLSGTRLVIDCANGASSHIAPELLASLGAEVITVCADPNGQNINADCGALYTEALQKKVVEARAQLGVAFDGDADRAMFVDDQGQLRDGDYILYILGKEFKSRSELSGSRIVATVMSNIGLELALKELGIELDRTSVGDKYVLEELLRTEGTIGGEQSGHIIFPRISLAGDGMITALQVLRVITERKKSLRDLSEGMHKYPQILINVKVSRKAPFESIPQIRHAAEQLEAKLLGRGRLLLRYSGTENLARVMIEGENQEEVNEQAEGLADVIRNVLG